MGTVVAAADATAPFEAELTIGPSAIEAYSRLSYTMWYALAEFVDNSTQSRMNYENVIDEVLKAEGKPLQIDITYNRIARVMRIEDNSIGMTKEKLIEALRVAVPTKDSLGRSKFGMGMKTAACWLGRKWQIQTCEWGSGLEWTADIDVEVIANGGKVNVTSKPVDTDCHYTRITVSELRRNIQTRTEETLKAYLGSMYMYDLKEPLNGVPVVITFNTQSIAAPTEAEWDTDMEGRPYFREIPEGTAIRGKSVSGFVGVLAKGGRKYGGFSLFQNRRQIQGFPNAWKPRSIFGGVDEEGANNLVSQRLTGVLQLDPAFGVSHTKDAILFEDDEEDQLEDFLQKLTDDYRQRANETRGKRGAKAWSADKIRSLIEGLGPEFLSTEMKDVLNTSQLPPIDAITANNRQRVDETTDADTVATLPIAQGLTIKIVMRETSTYEPYVTISPGADTGVIYVLINSLHPYYQELTPESAEECVTQFMYDAVAEYKAKTLITSPVLPDSVRNLKDQLMRVRIHRNENANFTVQRQEVEALNKDLRGE